MTYSTVPPTVPPHSAFEKRGAARRGFLVTRIGRAEHDAISRAAVRRGETVSDLVRRALKRELELIDREAGR